MKTKRTLMSFLIMMVAMVAAAVVGGCGGLEPISGWNFEVVVATQVLGVGEGNTEPPGGCEEMENDVRWTLTTEGGTELVVEPDLSLFIAGGFTDDSPPTPLPGRCIFRADVSILCTKSASGGCPTTGPDYEVQAQRDVDSSQFSTECTFAPVLDLEPCEIQDWIGFTSTAEGPFVKGCNFQQSLSSDENICGPGVHGGSFP